MANINREKETIPFTGNFAAHVADEIEDREDRLAEIHQELTKTPEVKITNRVEKLVEPVDDRFVSDPVSGRLRYADDWRDR